MQRWGLYFHTTETIQKRLAQIQEETTLNICMKFLFPDHFICKQFLENY